MQRKGSVALLIILIVIALAVIIGGVWYYEVHKTIPPSSSQQAVQQEEQNPSDQPDATSGVNNTDSNTNVSYTGNIPSLQGFSPTGDGLPTTMPCNETECLTWYKDDVGNYFLQGYGQVVGYYTIVSSTDDEGNIIPEDALIVTGGSKVLVDAYTQLVEGGNTLNGITPNGKLILMLGEHYPSSTLTQLDPVTVATLLKVYRSTPQDPITLEIDLADPSYKD